MKYDFQTDSSIRLIDAVHSNREIVDATCDRINSLACAFDRVGNHSVAEELFDMIEPLMQSARQVTTSYSIDLGEQVRHGENTAFGLLKVGLKMAELESSKSQS